MIGGCWVGAGWATTGFGEIDGSVGSVVSAAMDAGGVRLVTFRSFARLK